jgi:hypothetical protein
MGDQQLEEGGCQWPSKFIDSGYHLDQLCMRRVVLLQVPTPKNNSVHDDKADLATAEPEDEDYNVKLPSEVGREEPLAEAAAIYKSSPTCEFCVMLR